MIGKAEGISIGEARGLGLALRDLLEARFGTLPQSVLPILRVHLIQRLCGS